MKDPRVLHVSSGGRNGGRATVLAPQSYQSKTVSAIRSYLLELRAFADDVVGRIDRCLTVEDRYVALLQREASVHTVHFPSTLIICGDFSLDPVLRTLRHRDRIVELSPSQFLIMVTLMRAEGQPVTRGQLNTAAGVRFSRNSGTRRSIDQQVLNIRKVLEEEPGHPKHLITVRRIGYRFVGTG